MPQNEETDSESNSSIKKDGQLNNGFNSANDVSETHMWLDNQLT